MKVVNHEILEALRARVLWAGKSPPRVGMVDGSAIYDPARDFRLAPEQHQAFDLVYLVENDLSDIKQWPLVLDEALRAVRPGGIIVIRTGESALLSVFQLANFLAKWTDGHHELIDQVADDARFLFTVRLTHPAPRLSTAAPWSFGLVTNGGKPASVAAFVDSVVQVRRTQDEPFEILLCGPEGVLSDLGERASHVRLVPQPENFAERGWITRKKNLLIQAARFENALIAHDRYVVPADFLEQVITFGGDFDVLVARQQTFAGYPLPDWVMISDPLNWTTPGWMEFGDYHPFAYGNGGATLGKTDRLRRTAWSELLFWGQAEDVEIARRLSDAGAVSRPARNLMLLSEPPRAGFVEGFERLPWLTNAYAQTQRPESTDREPLGLMGTAFEPTTTLSVGPVVPLTGSGARADALSVGLVFPQAWRETDGGLVWGDEGTPTLSFKMTLFPVTGAIVRLQLADGVKDPGAVIVRVNSLDLQAQVQGGYMDVLIPPAAVTASNIVHLWLWAVEPPSSITVRSFVMHPQTVVRSGRGRR